MVNRVANTLLVEHRGKTIPFNLNGEQKEITYLTRIGPLSGHVSKIWLLFPQFILIIYMTLY